VNPLDGTADPQAGTCPSAPPEPGSSLLGVVLERGQVAYVNPAVPVTDALLDGMAIQGVPIENRLRFSGPCVEHRCIQWVGAPSSGKCGLIDHALSALSVSAPPATLPRCAIRATCRWFEQRGRLACAACPEVIRRPTPG
jgi:hypothetical protein